MTAATIALLFALTHSSGVMQDAPPPPPDPSAFDEAPPPPPVVGDEPPPPPVVDAPAALSADDDDGDGEKKEKKKKKKKRKKKKSDDDGGGADPMLTGAAQFGAGFVTCVGCSLLWAFPACCLTIPLTPLYAIPVVGAAMAAAVSGLIGCGASGVIGAVVGAVETVVGNMLSKGEGSFLYPVLAGAGVGVAYGAVAVVLAIASALANPTGGPFSQTPQPSPLGALGPTVACGIAGLLLAAAAITCVALPAVPAIVYGLTSGDDDGGGDMDARATPPHDNGHHPVELPPPSRVALSGMAF